MGNRCISVGKGMGVIVKGTTRKRKVIGSTLIVLLTMICFSDGYSW